MKLKHMFKEQLVKIETKIIENTIKYTYSNHSVHFIVLAFQ